MNDYAPVTKSRSTACVTVPGKGLSPDDKQILLYACEAYDHVLQAGEYSWAEFATAVAQHYDLGEPRNRAVFDAMMRADGVYKAGQPASQGQPVLVPEPEPTPVKVIKPTKAKPFVFQGLWRNGGPQVVSRCKTMEDARGAARNFFANHLPSSLKGGWIKELDGTTHVFHPNGDYYCTIPPLA